MYISSLIVLFKNKIMNSSTVLSIFNANLKGINLEIKIWNNGPEFLQEDDIKVFSDTCSNKNIKFEIYEDVRNISLSKIYNYFLNKKILIFFYF